MTPKFDRLITELLGVAARKSEGRYWSTSKPGLSGAVRAPRNMNTASDSQRTKLGNQQYVGSTLDPRKKNRSHKNPDAVSIAKGIGGHIKIDGVNPKEIGAKVNSKQGDMEIKVAHPNGTYKVGPSHQTQFKKVERSQMDRYRDAKS